MILECAEDGCDGVAKKRGFCEKHYLRMKRAGRLSEFAPMPRGRIRRSRKLTKKKKGICAVDDCSSTVVLRGLCRACYHRLRNIGLITSDQTTRQQELNASGVCLVDGCLREPRHSGLCNPHHQRQLRYGDPTFIPERTKNIGTRKIDRLGYASVYRPEHPAARQNGYIFEHRLVMGEILGRDLLPHERVHHKRAKDNNAPGNLELWVINHPAGQRVQDLVTWAKEILRLYPDELIAQLELFPSRGVGSS